MPAWRTPSFARYLPTSVRLPPRHGRPRPRILRTAPSVVRFISHTGSCISGAGIATVMLIRPLERPTEPALGRCDLASVSRGATEVANLLAEVTNLRERLARRRDRARGGRDRGGGQGDRGPRAGTIRLTAELARVAAPVAGASAGGDAASVTGLVSLASLALSVEIGAHDFDANQVPALRQALPAGAFDRPILRYALPPECSLSTAPRPLTRQGAVRS